MEQAELQELKQSIGGLSAYLKYLIEIDVNKLEEEKSKLVLQKENAWIRVLKLQKKMKMAKYLWGGSIAAILIAGFITVFYFNYKSGSIRSVTDHTEKILPIEGKVLLSTNDGSNNERLLTSHEVTRIVQANPSTDITLTTPQGTLFNFVLSDGTKVWLNGSSSVVFPSIFSKERIIEVSGEVYFDVAKDSKRPFIVNSMNGSIKVLGTKFNVNSHNKILEVTLEEGSVSMGGKIKSIIIKPGEKAILKEGEVIEVEKANISDVLAWQQGYFVFKNTPLREVVQELQTAFDFQVEYRTNVQNIPFTGKFSKDMQFTRILELLGKTEVIKISVEGKKLIISGSGI